MPKKRRKVVAGVDISRAACVQKSWLTLFLLVLLLFVCYFFLQVVKTNFVQEIFFGTP